MRALFTLAAELELSESQDFYEQRQPGLGRAFLFEIANTVASIERLPEGWPLVSDIGRACRVRRFPYRIVYFMNGNEIVVLAIAITNAAFIIGATAAEIEPST